MSLETEEASEKDRADHIEEVVQAIGDKSKQ